MADHGHHDPGGHELEAINTKLLFRLLISLSLVTLLAAAAVVQWFNSQRRELERRYAAEGSFQLADYKTKMAADLDGVDRVAQDMAANPDLLKAPPAPAGWIHPDDLVGGPAAAPAAPAEKTPTNFAPAPTEAPTDAPAEAPAEDAGEGTEKAPVDGGDHDHDAAKHDAKVDADKGNNGKAAEKQAENAEKKAEKKADKADDKADEG